MIEQVVITCLKQIPDFAKIKMIVESQNAPHPMREIFILVGSVLDTDEGTSHRTTYSRNGMWHIVQTKSYDVTIAVHGEKNKGVDALSEDIKLMLDIPPVRQLFFELGYTLIIDDVINKMPSSLETDQYVRSMFKVKLKTTIERSYSDIPLHGVQLGGIYKDGQDEGKVIDELIPEDIKEGN